MCVAAPNPLKKKTWVVFESQCQLGPSVLMGASALSGMSKEELAGAGVLQGEAAVNT